MPTISTFYGIVIQMFWRDHNPPHFHVRYAASKAQIAIADLRVIRGNLPARAERFVLEWAAEHQAELMEVWEQCQRQEQPKPIAPLP